LSSKAVCLVGAGSLGSGIARLLLQSGVGRIALIDPDKLVWANIERHELGAQCVDQNKAKALAATFKGNFPLAETEGYDEGWRAVYRASPAVLNEADLVVSTCADWNAESALSDLQRTKVLKGPVLYGWLEESALAAHAVALAADGPCLRCGFTATGGYLFPVVRAPTGPAVACGVGISLYGAIDLAPAQAMIAGVALDLLLGKAQPVVHRVLCCPQPTLEAAGGDWSPDWVAKYGALPGGGTTVASEWPTAGSCICRS
jgi:sulfur-carrier protein adenylyltransferase/sulfurtransferase